jgi:hypothetical protein
MQQNNSHFHAVPCDAEDEKDSIFEQWRQQFTLARETVMTAVTRSVLRSAEHMRTY